MHTVPGLEVLYFGTPVVDQSCLLGLSDNAHTTANLHRERECVLNLPSSSMVDSVDRIALTTGRRDVPDYRRRVGYRYEADKFALGGLTRQPSEVVRPPRIAECPIQLECQLTTSRRPTPRAGGCRRSPARQSRHHSGLGHVDRGAVDDERRLQ